MDLQAMDRAHRIGQKKEVQVVRFCTENSIEEKVIEKAYKKLRLDALVIQQGRLQDNTSAKVNKDDLLSMVRYGAELVFSSEAANITGALLFCCCLFVCFVVCCFGVVFWHFFLVVCSGPHTVVNTPKHEKTNNELIPKKQKKLDLKKKNQN